MYKVVKLHNTGRTQFRTGTKRTETARIDCGDAHWSLEIKNKIDATSTLNSNLLHSLCVEMGKNAIFMNQRA